MKGNNKDKKSINLSSRIDLGMYNQLVEKADSEGISLNSLTNSIIKRYLVWEQFSDDIGLIPLTKRSIKKIFKTMNENDIKRIAKEVGGTVPQELIYLSYDTFDFNNLMKMIEISDSRFGKVKYYENDDTCSINIIHGIGEKFSMFLSESHRVLTDNLSIKYTCEHLDNNMICMKFQKPSI